MGSACKVRVAADDMSSASAAGCARISGASSGVPAPGCCAATSGATTGGALAPEQLEMLWAAQLALQQQLQQRTAQLEALEAMVAAAEQSGRAGPAQPAVNAATQLPGSHDLAA